METSAPLLAPAVASSMRHSSAVVRKQAALAILCLVRDAPLGMATCATGGRGVTEVRWLRVMGLWLGAGSTVRLGLDSPLGIATCPTGSTGYGRNV